MRSKNFDLILCLLLTVPFSYCGYKFFIDTFPPQFSEDRNVMAAITYITKTVKRKDSGQLAWDDAKLNVNLYNNDQIYTHEASSAKIKLTDGPELNIQEKTLFKLEKISDVIDLQIKKGTVYIRPQKGKSKTRIKIANKEVELDSEDAEMKVVQSEGNAKFVMVKGSARISSDEQEIELKEEQQLEIDKSGKEEVREVEVVLLNPGHEAISFYKEIPNLTLEWKINRPDGLSELIIAEDDDFEKVLSRKSVVGSSLQMKSLKAGKYFWKVVHRDGEEVSESSVRSFLLKQDLPPDLLTPAHGEVVSIPIRIDGNNKNALLTWESEDEIKYELNVLKNGKEFYSQNVKGKQLLVENLSEGEYQWKVRILNPLRPNSPWTIKKSFKVAFIGVPPPPQLLSPLENAVLRFPAPKLFKINFTWNQKDIVPATEIEISRDKENVLLSKTIAKTSFTWGPEKPGTYYWRIRSLDTFSRETKFSPWQDVSIEINSLINKMIPRDQETVLLNSPSDDVTFEWNFQAHEDLDLKDEPKIEIASDEQFRQKIKNEAAESKSFSWKSPKEGSFYWRVIQYTDDNLPIYSPVKSLNVQRSRPVLKPKIKKLEKLNIEIKRIPKKTSFNLFDWIIPKAMADDFSTIVNLRWQAVEGAKKYQLEIYKDREMKNIIVKTETDSSNFEWENSEVGKFYWRISAIDGWDRDSGFSDLGVINVEAPVYLTKMRGPLLLSPAHTAHFVEGTSEKIKLKWERQKGIKHYTLKIARDLSFHDPLFEKEFESNEASFDFSEIKKLDRKIRTFYWRVVSTNALDKSAKSKRRSFTFRNKEDIELEEEKEQKRLEVIKKGIELAETNGLTFDKSFMAISSAPTKVDYTLTKEPLNVTLDGQAVNSILLESRNYFWRDHFIDFTFNRISGEVFKTLKYSDMSANLNWGWQFKNYFYYSFYAALGVHYNSQNVYKKKTISTITEETETQISGLLKLGADYLSQSENKHILEAGFGGGGQSIIMASYNYHFIFKSGFLFKGGAAYIKKSFETATGAEVSKNDIQANLGCGFEF